MQEIEPSVSPVEGRPRFDPIDAAVGVITQPVAAMRQIAAARPWRVALLLYLAITLLGTLASFTAPGADLADEALSPDAERWLETLVDLLSSPAFAVLSALASPFLLVAWTGLLALVGRWLGGRGLFSALLSTQAFAAVPSVLLAPLTALLNLADVQWLTSLLSLGFGIWMLALSVVGVRESLGLSTGRAVLTVLVPGAIVFLVVVALAILYIVVAVAAYLAEG